MIRGIKEHLFAVLRDIVYIHDAILGSDRFDLDDPASITNAVYHILRNARDARPQGPARPRRVLGRPLDRARANTTTPSRSATSSACAALNVCTGCGPGAMKGPMKGATIGHAKQRIRDGRYIGMTEPGIIAAEPPNPIVNQLVIMPDIEKRLEAFVRLRHGIVVFPGGAGTAEEILYLLGILLDPGERGPAAAARLHRPAVGRASTSGSIDRFIGATLGADGAEALQDHHRRPGRRRRAKMLRGLDAVRELPPARKSDAYNYNWLLQHPAGVPAAVRADARSDGAARAAGATCRPTCSPRICAARSPASSPATSRNRAFMRSRSTGRSRCTATAEIMRLLDELLAAFVAQQRMKLAGEYRPCYRLVA